MNCPKNIEKSHIETKAIVFLTIIALAGLVYIDSAAAGGPGMSLKGLTAVQTAGTGKNTGPCPQPRKTASAPAHLSKTAIPADADAGAGEAIFQKTAKPMACKMCHGKEGQGNGKLGMALNPKPRNFSCETTMKQVSPGQMFWTIKNGSKGTGMVAHGKSLTDKQIWDVVKYIETRLVKR